MTLRKPGFFGYGSDYDTHKANLSRTAVNLQRRLNAAMSLASHKRAFETCAFSCLVPPQSPSKMSLDEIDEWSFVGAFMP